MDKFSDDPSVQAAAAIRSLTTIAERERVAELAREVPAGGVILEVGTLYGGTTALLALAAPLARVYTVDDFSWHPADDVPTSPELAYANMEKVGAENVLVLNGDSRIFGADWRESLDLIFIDGGHSYDFVYRDLSNFGPHTKVISLHDYDNPAWMSVKQAVDQFLIDRPEFYLDKVVGQVATLRRKATA